MDPIASFAPKTHKFSIALCHAVEQYLKKNNCDWKRYTHDLREGIFEGQNLASFHGLLCAHVANFFPYLHLEIAKNEKDLKWPQQIPKALVDSYQFLRELFLKDEFTARHLYECEHNFFVKNEPIHSNRYLTHYVPDQFILEVLESRAIFPSFLSSWEFLSPNNPDYDFLDYFEPSASRIALEWQYPRKSIADALELANWKLPIYTCFTSTDPNKDKFHQKHYGSTGIVFYRDSLLKKYIKCDPSRRFGPVKYCNIDESLSIDLLRKAALTESPAKAWMELLLYKPLRTNLAFSSAQFYSPYFEHEWRYISNEKIFSFEPSDIAYIMRPIGPSPSDQNQFSILSERWQRTLKSLGNPKFLQI